MALKIRVTERGNDNYYYPPQNTTLMSGMDLTEVPGTVLSEDTGTGTGTIVHTPGTGRGTESGTGVPGRGTERGSTTGNGAGAGTGKSTGSTTKTGTDTGSETETGKS